MSQESIDELTRSINRFLKEPDIKIVRKAIGFSAIAHQNQKRKSSEPFIIHPLKTALILCELRPDRDTIVAAILHDVLEDTGVSSSEIKKNFGSDVLALVESVTKLSTVRIKKGWFPFGHVDKKELPEFERQTETLRKMLIAMAKDIRVILIKLADKIHNMQTLQYLDAQKRERISSEVIEIYAPIAGRLGIGKWKGLLEDLAFPYTFPAQYKKLREFAVPQIKVRERYLEKFSKNVWAKLEENDIKSSIDFRAKRWFSLYQKLQKHDGDISKIYDLIALRVIVDSIEDCYAALGVIHSIWRPLIGRIKDFIALPKPNGYQSIHTTIFADEGRIVEIQIRTSEMNYQAEFGVAAHWVYKKDKRSRLPNKDELTWLKDFDRLQRSISSPVELAKLFKMDFFENRIFVFTPDGDVRDLPVGATPIDFAYSIHSAVGNRAAGAKINGRIASFDTKLQNGDIVEIITKKQAHPKSDWLEFAKTQNARSQIKRSIK